MMKDKHDNQEFDPCAELAKARRELDAFIAAANQRIAFMNGAISMLERLCRQPVPPVPDDAGPMASSHPQAEGESNQ